MRKTNKRGSLNLSINAIVIIVLAMTMLGLGLGFVRNMFKDLGSTTNQVQEQVKQQILEDLRTGDKKLSFPTNRVTGASKEKVDLAVGVKNTNDQPLCFALDIINSTSDSLIPDDGPGSYLWDNNPQELSAGDSVVIPILYQTPTDQGTKQYKFVVKECAVNTDSDCSSVSSIDVCDDGYAAKALFVTVQ